MQYAELQITTNYSFLRGGKVRIRASFVFGQLASDIMRSVLPTAIR